LPDFTNVFISGITQSSGALIIGQIVVCPSLKNPKFIINCRFSKDGRENVLNNDPAHL